MSDFHCPRCGGGFPNPVLRTDTYGRPEGDCCPWCGLNLDGGYEGAKE